MFDNKAMSLAGYFSVLVLTAGFAGAGELEFHTVEFHQFHNQNLQVILDRIASPGISPKGEVTFLDVPFFIPATGLNMWHSLFDHRPNPRDIEIPVGIRGVVEVYTLLNCDRGQPGPQSYAHLEFNGSGGASFRKDLIGGVDIRDYYNDGFQNTINGTTTKQVWYNGVDKRLDMQRIVLPAAFGGQVLESIRVVEEGGDQIQRIWLNGLTVATPPGPPFKLSVEQSGLKCVGVWLENRIPVRGGECGIAYDPSLLRPVKVRAGSALPEGTRLFSQLTARNECPPESDVESGFTAGWILPSDSPLPPGKHQVLLVCFEAVSEAEPNPCSPLRFISCLGIPGALVDNVVTDEDNATQAVGTEDGQVCIQPEPPFRRGDANDDGRFDISDPISVIGCLFLGSDCGPCPDASDVNDDGAADLSDPISLLTWRFLDGPQPNAPFPDCGVDPAKDALEDCLGFSGCSG